MGLPNNTKNKFSKEIKKGFAWGLFSQGFGPTDAKKRLSSIFGDDGLCGNGTISTWYRDFQLLKTGSPTVPCRFRPRYFPVYMKERALTLFREGRNWREIADILSIEYPNDSVPDRILIYKWRKRWIQAGYLDGDTKPDIMPRMGRPSESQQEFIQTTKEDTQPLFDEQLAKMSAGELEKQADILLFGHPGRNKSKYIVNHQRFSLNYNSPYAESDDDLRERNEMAEIWEQQSSGVTMPDTEWWDDDDIPATSTRRKKS